MEPAISAMSMRLPGVRLYPFSMTPDEIRSISKGADLISRLDIYPTDRPHFFFLADPESCDTPQFLRVFNEGYKGLPIVGGLASGGVIGSPNWIYLNGTVLGEGAAGVALTGEIEFEVIVSQGCGRSVSRLSSRARTTIFCTSWPGVQPWRWSRN